MKLSLVVTKGTTGIDNPRIYGKARATFVGPALVFEGLTPGHYLLSLRSLSGSLLGRTDLNAVSGTASVALPANASGHRILAVLEAPGMETRTIPVLVP
jgi:hypothetical protein